MTTTGVKFDKTVNLGQIATILVVLFAMIAAFFRLEGRVDLNAGEIQHAIEDIADVEQEAREEKLERKDDRKEIMDMMERILTALNAKQDKSSGG